MEKLMTEKAEKLNGWAAMLGFVVLVGTYATTGQIIPGIFQKFAKSRPAWGQLGPIFYGL